MGNAPPRFIDVRMHSDPNFLQAVVAWRTERIVAVLYVADSGIEIHQLDRPKCCRDAPLRGGCRGSSDQAGSTSPT